MRRLRMNALGLGRGRTLVVAALVGAVLAPLSIVALAPPAAADWSPAQAIAPVTITSGGNGTLYGMFTSISCPTATFCLAGQQNGQVIFWNGSWQQVQVVDDNPVFGLNNIPTYVSCSSGTFCMAVVYGDAMYWNGTTWSAPDQVDSNSLSAIACLSSSFCMAADSSGAIINWNGKEWSAYPLANHNAVTGLSCATTSYCIAVTSSGTATQWNGSSWSTPVIIDPVTAEPENGNDLDAVSCLSSTECLASDTAGNVVEGSGSSWTQTLVDADGLTDLSCAATTCLGLDYQEASVDGVGSTWSAPTLVGLGNLSPATAVSCATATFCMAVGNGTADEWDGSGWHYSVPVSEPVDGPRSVSCTTSSFCVAVAGTTVATWNGTSWSQPANIDNPANESLTSVSCVSTTLCMAADGRGYVLKGDGSSWTPQLLESTTPDENPPSVYVSCSSATFCMAVDSYGNAFQWNGTGWSGPSLIDSIGQPKGITCVAGHQLCMAIDTSGYAIEFNGTSWLGGTSIDGVSGAGLTAITCPILSFCMVIDNAGDDMTWNGTVWSAPAFFDTDDGEYGNGQPVGVSCVSATDCVSMAGDATEWTWNGSSWSSRTAYYFGADGYSDTITCVGSFCVDLAGGSWGYLNGLEFESGTDWVTLTPPDPFLVASGEEGTGTVTSSPAGVDCPPTCSAPFATGTAVTLTAQPGPSSYFLEWEPPSTSAETSYCAPGGASTANPVCSFTITGNATELAYFTPGATLSVTTAGTGSGIVTSSPSGIDCGAVCSAGFELDSTVVLTAAPSAGSSFGGWSGGACTGTGSCSVGMTSDASVTATFTLLPTTAYTPVTPYRVCDTRGTDGLSDTDAQCAGQPLGAGGTLNVQITGTNPSGTSSGGVPASGVDAVVINVTATGESAQGYLTVWPAGTPRPTASSLNYQADRTVPNLVTVGVSASGQVSIYSLQATNVVVDVEGYYAAPAGTAGLFNSLTPYRICDTRSGNGLTGTDSQCTGNTLAAGGTLDVQVTGTNASGSSSAGVPATGVSAVVLNVTAVGHGTGYVTAYPAGVSPPTASNLNFVTGQVVPNRVIVPVGSGGQISLTSNTSTDLIVDVNGWFTDGSSPSQAGALFVAATTPSRICDTRSNGNSTPCAGQTVTGGNQLEVAVAGQGPVPTTGVVAVVANVTTTDTTAQSYLTAWPTGQPRPTASDLNWVAALTVPNMAVVGLGTGGTISLYVNGGSADAIVDVMGWYLSEG